MLFHILEAIQLQEEFKNVVVKLDGTKCLCSIKIAVDDSKCSGKGKCSKRCSGNGIIKIGKSSFNLIVKKGNANIMECKMWENSGFEESILLKNTSESRENILNRKEMDSNFWIWTIGWEMLERVINMGSK
eukprot:TRINITY_DN30512_c0_g1_i1.p1 TRINITY_DN30512_c0_g1~~TRINITY_DN30512_c0_g1_i1.p1  ORF type:complete len:131 (-),score=14.04 TRINITY_DN30512_c0_g1_i1:243-635(-)